MNLRCLKASGPRMFVACIVMACLITVRSTDTASTFSDWMIGANLRYFLPHFERQQMTLSKWFRLAEDEERLEHYLIELNLPRPAICTILDEIRKVKQDPVLNKRYFARKVTRYGTFDGEHQESNQTVFGSYVVC